MILTTKFLATGVGSMPYLNPAQALEISFKYLSEAPIWPQLTQTGLNEQMDAQYSEGMPCLVTDREKNRIYFNTAVDTSDALAAFYETYLQAMDADEGNGDCSALAISPQYSQGIYAALKWMQEKGRRFPYFKVHTTGPCTFALNTVDENKRAIYYNEEFRDIIIKALAMKCRWQIQKFQPFAEKIICFIDEPILSAFGSSTYVSVGREEIVAHLYELIEAIHQDGAIAGIHCCGNTEWSILVDAGVDILNFDAFEFGESITMYPGAIKELMDRGGAIAWGIVPTSEKVNNQTIEGLTLKLNGIIDQLATQGIDKQKLLEQSIVTPSCGTGSLKPETAEKVFSLTAALSSHLKNIHGF